MLPRVSRGSVGRSLSLAALVAALLAFYAWTAATSVGPNLADRPATSNSLGATDKPIDPSNELAHAILHGRFDLGLPVPPGLRRAKDIHDPAGRGYLSSDYLDLSYYRGRFYTYWGPAPVVLLFVPAHLLGFGYVSQALGVLLFSALALLLGVALLWVLTRRFFPALPHWAFLVGVAALGTGDLLPYLLSRPEVYELAIASALCFATAALLCFVCGLLRERRSLPLVALGSLFAGLAFASRVPIAIVLVVGAVLIAWPWVRTARPSRSEAARTALALLGPFAACFAAYAAYNAARFGSPLDFGNSHQLQVASVAGQSTTSAQNVPPGLWYYLLAPPRLRLQFPYLWLPPGPGAPVPTPAHYGPVEPTAGLLPTLPFVLALVLAPYALRRRPAELKVVVAAFTAVAAVLVVFLASLFASATMRYEVDYRTLLLVPALLVWFAVLGAARRRRRRRAVAAAGVVLALWGIAASMLVTLTGEKGRLAQLHPGTLASLASFFSPLPTAAAQVAGHPMIAAVDGTTDVPPFAYDRLSLDGMNLDVGGQAVILQVVSPSTRVYRLRTVAARDPGIPVTARLRIGVSANRTGQFAPPTPGPKVFPIQLEQGLNDVRVEVDYDARQLAPAPDQGLVSLADIRIR